MEYHFKFLNQIIRYIKLMSSSLLMLWLGMMLPVLSWAACPPGCPPAPPASKADCNAALVVTPLNTLNFGDIVPTLVNEIAIMSEFNVAGGTATYATGSIPRAATFQLSTSPLTTCSKYFVSVINVTVGPIALSNMAQTMSMDSFTTDPVAGAAKYAENMIISVGATLNVAASQAAGTYSTQNAATNITIDVSF